MSNRLFKRIRRLIVLCLNRQLWEEENELLGNLTLVNWIMKTEMFFKQFYSSGLSWNQCHMRKPGGWLS